MSRPRSPAAGRPLEVLVATPDFPPAPGGIQHLVHRLVVSFSDARVRAVAPAQGEPPVALPAPHTVVTAPAGGKRRAIAGLNAAVLRDGLAHPPDVVLSAHIVASPAARALQRLRGVPYVQYLHAQEVPHRPRLARGAVRGAAATVAVSRHTRDLALAVGAPAERVHVIHPGVDLPAEVPREREQRPTILTVARMDDAYKGHDVLIGAMARVVEQLPGAHMVFIGDGRLRPELQSRAATACPAGAVTFTGAVSDAERDRWLDRAHVFAMPSRLPPDGGGEGFGIVFLEASARGLPVVAGAVAGALDAVADGETGLLVDPERPEAVASAILRLLGDPPLAERLGRQGAERARAFAWPAVAERVEALLAEVARR
jgi:phosphatidyl-myo-inositol dimannoside synthase